ncbi:hypothetical protein BVC80_7091g4 [Macleaya cordata]|uniref:Apple domain-containing protein n=1 Tax=Macleaya cordata TaxID=56857 RepID=A0A200PNP1_MACCD|nr:hypothetical protein BVC80_9065g111 [Macleaya cordata]OVA19053.1 hypothetical protein BVC80_7091g4 [Macleaya cordata]
MAKLVWGFGGGRGKLLCCSYKRTTIVICSINFVAALYILHSLYTSFYIFSNNASSPNYTAKFTEDQIKRMEESIRIRKAAEPLELIKVVKEIKEESSREEGVVELSRPMKQNIADEILQRLKGLNHSATVSEQRAEALEIWRKQKLEEANQLQLGKENLSSTSSAKDANMLRKALESDWNMLLEEIGVWFPAEIINKEHDDRPEGEEEPEDQIIAGRPLPPECNAELHTDYAGAAVRWGLTHHKESAADCCQACLDQAKNAKPGEMKCNIWVYCPSENGCHSPDIYEHKHQECWLKQADIPKVTFKKKYSQSYRNAHPSAPVFVPWLSGVIST